MGSLQIFFLNSKNSIKHCSIPRPGCDCCTSGISWQEQCKPSNFIWASYASSISTNTPPQSLGCKNTTGLPWAPICQIERLILILIVIKSKKTNIVFVDMAHSPSWIAEVSTASYNISIASSPPSASPWRQRMTTRLLFSTHQSQENQTAASPPVSTGSPCTLTSTKRMIHTTLSQ